MLAKYRLPAGSLAALIVATTVIPPARPVHASVQPGDVITKTNVDKIEGLVSPGVEWVVRHGMELTITPYKRISPVPAFQEATEKYGGQARINPNNHALENWTAGRPFPTIDPNDPQAADKIMYDVDRTQAFTDDQALHLLDAETGQMAATGQTPQFDIERHFVIDWLRVLQYSGRTENPPIPAIPNNPDGVFRKTGQYSILEPFDLKGVGLLSYRYLDPAKQDDTWLYLPSLRRVRRLSSAERSDALFGQDTDLDSYGVYSGQTAWFDWKLLGTRPMLASLHGENVPPKVCPGDGGATFCENWELRPAMYVVEGTPKVKNYAYSKRVIYIDKESFLPMYSDLYDPHGELWKTVIQNIRTSTKPNPNVSFEYKYPRSFIYGFMVVDMQLNHATRAAIPGMKFPNEPGWYVNQGDKYGTNEAFFTLSAMVEAGRGG